jgi:hypothetical protein
MVDESTVNLQPHAGRLRDDVGGINPALRFCTAACRRKPRCFNDTNLQSSVGSREDVELGVQQNAQQGD